MYFETNFEPRENQFFLLGAPAALEAVECVEAAAEGALLVVLLWTMLVRREEGREWRLNILMCLVGRLVGRLVGWYV